MRTREGHRHTAWTGGHAARRDLLYPAHATCSVVPAVQFIRLNGSCVHLLSFGNLVKTETFQVQQHCRQENSSTRADRNKLHMTKLETQETSVVTGKVSRAGIEPQTGCNVSARLLLAYSGTKNISSVFYQTIQNERLNVIKHTCSSKELQT